jgi:hypothetical protein
MFGKEIGRKKIKKNIAYFACTSGYSMELKNREKSSKAKDIFITFFRHIKY